MKARLASVLACASLLAAGCATDGTGGPPVDFYGGLHYYDDWYVGGCCIDYPGDIGPPGPRPEHPIALPPGSAPRPEQPIAAPPKVTAHAASTARSMPSPRPAASMGGGGRGGGRR
jgi:hypothetical protein